MIGEKPHPNSVLAGQAGRMRGAAAALNALHPLQSLLVIVCFILSIAWLGIAVRFGMVPVKAPLVDRLGGVAAGDFMYFYSVAVLSSHGRAADVYNPNDLTAVARDKLDPHVPDLVWPYPPTMSILLAPMGRLTPGAALVAWLGLAVAALLTVGRLAFRQWRWAPIVLLFPGSALALFTGQFSSVLALLLTVIFVRLDRAPAGAGVALGLLVLKPQFALAPTLGFLLARRWRAILGAAATGAAVMTVSVGLFGLRPWATFLNTAFRHSQVLDVETPMARFVTLFATLHSYGVSQPAALLWHVLISVPVAIAALKLWQRAERESSRALGLACATLIITPYALDYDLVLLLAPWCLAIYEACQEAKAALSWFWPWLVLTVLAPLVYVTQLYTHRAIAAPVLIALALTVWWRDR